MLEVELLGVTSPRGDKSRVDVGRFFLFFTHPGLQLLLLGHSWALLGRFWVLLGHSGAFPGPPDLEGSCPSPDPPSPRRCHVPDRRERSGQIKSGHPRPGGDKSPIDVRGQAKSNQVRSGHFVTSPRGDKSPSLWDVFSQAGQIRSGQVRSGQVR